MSAISPVLDQPQSFEYEGLPEGAINRLANQDLFCLADANSDALEVTWPWADAVYARRISLSIADWQDGPLAPLAVRFFPGHQETIAGAEGMIVTKRLITPWKSPDDKALVWLLECQAEGDRLLRLEVAIDWGEPLSQRMVDGLLVAQRNPEPARGIYAQSNAESTRVFGNPYGRPDEVEIDDPQRARLVYHVLVNGMVEVPLLLTVSDVGEQVAWNGFLSLRDVEQVFDASSESWGRLLRAGRLWTPHVAFNHAVHAGKLQAIRQVQRWRGGWGPSDGRMDGLGALVDAWDAIDPSVSRNLLAHVRRLADERQGDLPGILTGVLTGVLTEGVPSAGQAAGAEPGAALEAALEADGAANIGMYFSALEAHLRHHGDGELPAAHLPSVRLCAERLIQLRVEREQGQPAGDPAGELAGLAVGLERAARLALAAGSAADAARWESEAAYLAGRQAAGGGQAPAVDAPAVDAPGVDAPAVDAPGVDGPGRAGGWLEAVRTAGAAVWGGCGVRWEGGEICVEPSWPRGGGWWALLGLPLANGKHLSLLWDGETLHATQAVLSSLPVQMWKRIQIHGTDEFDFDPYFELTRETHAGDTAGTERFKPKFSAG